MYVRKPTFWNMCSQKKIIHENSWSFMDIYVKIKKIRHESSSHSIIWVTTLFTLHSSLPDSYPRVVAAVSDRRSNHTPVSHRTQLHWGCGRPRPHNWPAKHGLFTLHSSLFTLHFSLNHIRVNTKKWGYVTSREAPSLILTTNLLTKKFLLL